MLDRPDLNLIFVGGSVQEKTAEMPAVKRLREILFRTYSLYDSSNDFEYTD